MDIATVIGLVGTLGLIAWAMNSAAGLGAFIDPASVVIVFVGSIMVLLMRSTLPEFINAWAKVLMKTILNSNEDPGELIQQIVSMANISRGTVYRSRGSNGRDKKSIPSDRHRNGRRRHRCGEIETKLNNDVELMAYRHAEASGCSNLGKISLRQWE